MIKLGLMLAMALSVVLTVLAPATADAGVYPRTVKTSTFESGQKCYKKNGESYCETSFGHSSYTLLKVEGLKFSKNAAVWVEVSVLGGKIINEGSKLTDANGAFVYHAMNVEYCTAGYALNVRVYDFNAGAWSNNATSFSCAW